MSRDPLRIVRYLSPVKLKGSVHSHQQREDFRLGRANVSRERQSMEFASNEWRKEEVVARREFADYAAYVDVQTSKLDKIQGTLLEGESNRFERFKDTFRDCRELRDCRNVLCLGARLGTEVRALISLGHFAVGIDLNPGSENPYVLAGDFHDLVFADGSVDAVYTNVMDHALEPERKLKEVVRVLRPGGIFIMEISRGYDEGYIPDTDYSALAWSTAQDFVDYCADVGGLKLLRHQDLPNPPWSQAVFRKP